MKPKPPTPKNGAPPAPPAGSPAPAAAVEAAPAALPERKASTATPPTATGKKTGAPPPPPAALAKTATGRPPAHKGKPAENPLLALLVSGFGLKAEAVALLAEVSPQPDNLAGLKKLVLRQKLMAEEAFQEGVARLYGLPFEPHLEQVELPEEIVRQIPIRFAKKFMFFPMGVEEGVLKVAVENPEHFEPIEELGRKLGMAIQQWVTTHSALLSLINRTYERREEGQDQSFEGIETRIEGGGSDIWGIEDPEDLIDARDEEPVKRLLNNILYQATRSNTSDIHIESNGNELVVRFRVDGVLQTMSTFPRAIHLTLINRIKIMSRLDISQRSLPQDGRTPILVAGRKIDVRVSTMPTVHGEKAVMRLLYQDQEMFDLHSLGMPPAVYTTLKKMIRATGGIILVSGPTGSGKTTTLYAALSEIDRQAKNIMTIEDPVEYKIPGYVQTEVNAKLGLTFANALRSVLRQDPDIIMVGEMRDRETALIAIQSALTGHTVFSTVHTNDAPSSITRLVDMGIEPYLVTSTVLAVLAQRLVRRICPHCKEETAADPPLLLEVGVAQEDLDQFKTLYKGRGCARCRQTGYLGRVGVYELLVVDDVIKEVLGRTNESNKIREAAQKQGMVSMRTHGLELVKKGITTIEELVATTREN